MPDGGGCEGAVATSRRGCCIPHAVESPAEDGPQVLPAPWSLRLQLTCEGCSLGAAGVPVPNPWNHASLTQEMSQCSAHGCQDVWVHGGVTVCVRRLHLVHGPVPFYNRDLRKPVDEFMAALSPAQAYERSNWGVTGMST